MAETPIIEEKHTSPQFTLTEDELSIVTEFIIFNTDNPITGLSLLPGIGTQFEIDGQLVNSFVNNIQINSTEGQSPVFMTATVSYGKPDSEKSDRVEPEANVATWSLSTQAQAINLQKALDEQKNFPKGAFPEGLNTYLTIGQTDSGVEGVDVLRPSATLRIVHWLPEATATPAFLDEISLLVGTINDAPFSGPWGKWEAGEALYIGAEVSAPNEELIELSHSFERSFNSLDPGVKLLFLDKDRIVDNILFEPKKGWEYVWFQYGKKAGVVVDKDRPQDVAITAHIAKVYEEDSFDKLNLPTTFKSGSL